MLLKSNMHAIETPSASSYKSNYLQKKNNCDFFIQKRCSCSDKERKEIIFSSLLFELSFIDYFSQNSNE